MESEKIFRFSSSTGASDARTVGHGAMDDDAEEASDEDSGPSDAEDSSSESSAG
jgi:hypothetical protein